MRDFVRASFFAFRPFSNFLMLGPAIFAVTRACTVPFPVPIGSSGRGLDGIFDYRKPERAGRIRPARRGALGLVDGGVELDHAGPQLEGAAAGSMRAPSTLWGAPSHAVYGVAVGGLRVSGHRERSFRGIVSAGSGAS